MATKQITDLALAASFDAGDLLLVRKTGEGVDKAITQQTFIETMGNPAVGGFTATSTIVNKVVINPTNDVVIDKYYDKMVVTFISPITSTGAVEIGINGLVYKLMQEIGTTVTSTLVTGKFYEAIYDLASNKFYQTNIVIPYIFTNEYIAVGTVQPDQQSTKYALTTAIGTPKTATGYYTGMSALFTANIASKGAVILNIDGLGEKSLQDPVGDNIPFNLLANEAIFAIYDGTVFRKRMFTDVEPIDLDPIDPPVDMVVNVGPSRAVKTITDAVAQLYRDYPNGGITVTIQLDANYICNGDTITANAPWITVKTAVGGNSIASSIQISGAGNINFEGIYNIKYSDSSYGCFFINGNQSSPFGSAKMTLKSATLNAISDKAGHCYPIVFSTPEGTSIGNETVFEDVNLNNFTKIANIGYGRTQNFLYKNGAVTLKTDDTGYNSCILNFVGGSVSLQNINFSTISLPPSNNSDLISTSGVLNMNNVTIPVSSDNTIVFITEGSNSQSIITNCTLRNTTTSTAPEIISRAPLIIDGGNYKNTTIRVAPDIVAGDYAAAVIRLRNNPLGTTSKIGKGQIINE